MALVTLIGGPAAVFFVAPCAAAITLLLVHRLTRQWYDAETALVATALVAWNPLFITYAKQPMIDVPATMWMVLALVLAIRSSTTSAFGAARRRRARDWARHADGDSESLVRIAVFSRIRRRIGVVLDRAPHDEPRHICPAGLHGPGAVMDPGSHRRPVRRAARTEIEAGAHLWRSPAPVPFLPALRSLGDTAVFCCPGSFRSRSWPSTA
jgi:hypothetical protein